MPAITRPLAAIVVVVAVVAALAGSRAIAQPPPTSIVAVPAPKPTWQAFCSGYATLDELNRWFADRGAEGWEPMTGGMTITGGMVTAGVYNRLETRFYGCVRRQAP